jgi:hypothetical protein
MEAPKPSETIESNTQPPAVETSPTPAAEKPHFESSGIAGSAELKIVEPSYIELDIKSDSDFDPDDLAHVLLAEPAEPRIRILNKFIADAFVHYRDAKRAAKDYGQTRAEYWEERADRHADRAIKWIELAEKMESHGQQKVVVEHRNDPDRQGRTGRRVRAAVRQPQDASALATNRKA